MTGLDPSNLWWIAAGCCALAIVSAVVPWVNAEAIMLGAIPLAGSSARLAVLVAVVTLGQMTGKTIVYWISRNAASSRAPRLPQAIDRWRERLERRKGSADALILVSSIVGLPPFYLVSIAAGALELAFPRFLAVGTIGRLAHFAAVAFLPQLLWRIP